MNTIPVSTVLLTKNSMQNLPRYFASMREVDDVILLDGGSADETVSYAMQQPNVRAFPQNPAYLDEHGYIIDFSSLRNEGYTLARYRWILCVDADEEASPALLSAVSAIIDQGRFGVYFVKRKLSLEGREVVMFERSVSDHVRLFHLSSVRGCIKPVHERLDIISGAHIGFLDVPVTVPLAPAKSLRAKYDRYLVIEARSRAGISFGTWFKWVLLRNLFSITRMTVAWLLTFFIPRRGPRLPFGNLWEQVRYLWVLTWRIFPSSTGRG